MSISLQSAAAALRFADGNLRIQLGGQGDEDLLINKETLAANCPMLEPLLRSPGSPGYSPAWDKSTEVRVKDKGSLRLWTLSLKIVDSTWVLESGSFVKHEHREETIPFEHSDLANEEYPGYEDLRSSPAFISRPTAATQVITLVKICYGMQVDLSDLLPFELSMHRAPRRETLFCLTDSIIELCARAEYMGCFALVSGVMNALVFDEPLLWRAIADHPWRFLQLGAKLRNENIYFNAMRHILAAPNRREDQSRLAEHLGMSDEEMELFRQSLLAQQDAIIDGVCTHLVGLAGDSNRLRFFINAISERITLLSQLATQDIAKHERQNRRRCNDKCHSIAQEFWQRWMKSQGFEQNGSKNASVPKQAMEKIEKYSKHPGCIMLLEDDMKEALARARELPTRYEPHHLVEHHIRKIFRDAAEIIRNVFQTRAVRGEGGEIRTYRCANFDEAADYFTLLPLDENKKPWNDDMEEEEAELNVVAFGRNRASADLLRAVGIS